MSNFEKVKEFHDKFYSFDLPKIPTCPSDSRLMLRSRLMMEELAEVVESMQMKDLPGVAKELADLLYVVYGTADEFGIDMDAVFDTVHQSNMTKTPSNDGRGKAIKGEDYQPVDLENILSQGELK